MTSITARCGVFLEKLTVTQPVVEPEVNYRVHKLPPSLYPKPVRSTPRLHTLQTEDLRAAAEWYALLVSGRPWVQISTQRPLPRLRFLLVLLVSHKSNAVIAP